MAERGESFVQRIAKLSAEVVRLTAEESDLDRAITLKPAALWFGLLQARKGKEPMGSTDQVLWGIHAGDSGEADALFLSGFVALDGAAMGDIASIPDEPAAFKQRARAAFPSEPEKTIEQWAGQWRRFVHEAEKGDWIAYKSKPTGVVHLGRLSGPYSFEPQPDLDHAHLRPVRWVGSCAATTMPPHLQKAVARPNGFYELTDYKADLLGAFPGAEEKAGA